MKTITACFAVLLISCSFAPAQSYKVIWSFGGFPNDGAYPLGDLVSDRSGNLYGVTDIGGSGVEGCPQEGCGTVFMLSPQADGSWLEATIYNFCSDLNGALCVDGSYPSAGIAIDSSGNLFGTTYEGGGCPNGPGCGLVFELSPPILPGGVWTEKSLHIFCENDGPCPDGAGPYGRLVIDGAGNIYGTTSGGGAGSSNGSGGTVFELSPNGETWSETVIYNFCANGHNYRCPDGAAPLAGLTFDQFGNLYGTTSMGGSAKAIGQGTVYRLSPGASGWSETVLVHFPSGGEFTIGNSVVTLDNAGNVYTTLEDATGGYGGALKLNPQSGIYRILSFDGSNGSGPTCCLLSLGNVMYGTTALGGNKKNSGVLFKVEPNGEEKVLYKFCEQKNCADGKNPYGGVIAGTSGTFYGTTSAGGSTGSGAVFSASE